MKMKGIWLMGFISIYIGPSYNVLRGARMRSSKGDSGGDLINV
jgi:hypothetical protein